MLVNLASGSVGEFVFVVGRHWIAEHQRVDDPDSPWLHVPKPFSTGRWLPSRRAKTLACTAASTETALLHRQRTTGAAVALAPRDTGVRDRGLEFRQRKTAPSN